MTYTQHLDNEFSARFFADISRLYPESSSQYGCTKISDIDYCQLGVLRCLSSSTTGQELLQHHADQGIAHIEPDHFFKALQSKRRLANITSFNNLLGGPMKHRIADPYTQCRELDDWDLYAVDGHYHKAACIDYRHWYKLKHTYGIYFVTLEKSNSAVEVCSVNLVDHDDSRNEGVVSDHLVGTSNGVLLRRIVYTNPIDGVTYIYLTSEFTLSAYQVVLLYKHRWDIEKIFHQFKSKMNERKSWASSLEVKQGHAIFECLGHNLLLLFEQHIAKNEAFATNWRRRSNRTGAMW